MPDVGVGAAGLADGGLVVGPSRCRRRPALSGALPHTRREQQGREPTRAFWQAGKRVQERKEPQKSLSPPTCRGAAALEEAVAALPAAAPLAATALCARAARSSRPRAICAGLSFWCSSWSALVRKATRDFSAERLNTCTSADGTGFNSSSGNRFQEFAPLNCPLTFSPS